MGRLSGDGTIVAPRPCKGVYASSDIHSPRYLREFVSALRRRGKNSIRVLILAGDLIDKGRHQWFKPLLDAVEAHVGSPVIVAVFGNEEYEEARPHLKGYSNVTWLEDEYTIVDFDKCSLAIVGTSGALDRPTSWQRRNRPELWRVYRERPKRVAILLDEARRNADYVFLVSHYALSRDTIVGEPRRAWPELYSSMMEAIIREKRPDAAVHGHAHKGRRFALIGGVPVYNVALPLNRDIVEVRPRTGIDAFL